MKQAELDLCMAFSSLVHLHLHGQESNKLEQILLAGSTFDKIKVQIEHEGSITSWQAAGLNSRFVIKGL